MMANDIMALTDKSSVIEEWNALIHYQSGDSILISVNFNNALSCTGANDNNIDPISETVNAVIDGLYGHQITNFQSINKWQIFDDDDPNILFFGTDITVTDSVMLDYIIEEQSHFGHNSLTHSSLHQETTLGLDIPDHWNSFDDRQYSLNDYVNIELDVVDTTAPLPPENL